MDDFQDLLRNHIWWHSQQSVTYLDFKADLEKWVKANYTVAGEADALLAKIDWDAWVKAPGANPPNNGLDFTTVGAQDFEAMADYCIANAGVCTPANITAYKTTNDTQLQVIFLNRLTEKANLISYAIMAQLDKDMNITLAPNPEIG